MSALPLIFILDDDFSMQQVWQIASEHIAKISFFEDLDRFVKELQQADPQFVVLDRFFRHLDLVSSGFSGKLREFGYKGPVVLSSDLHLSESELTQHGFYGQIEKRKVNARQLLAVINRAHI